MLLVPPFQKMFFFNFSCIKKIVTLCIKTIKKHSWRLKHTHTHRTKVERKDIDLIDEEEAQIGGDRSSATLN